MKTRLTTTAALALSIFSAGCGSNVASTETMLPVGPGNTTIVTPSSGKDVYSGVYAVSSSLNLGQAGALPAELGTVLSSLNNVQTKPAETLYAIAVAYDSSLKLPSIVSTVALGAIDSVLTNPNSSYAAELANYTSIAQQLSTLVSGFEVQMSMTIANPDAKGNAAIDQQITGVKFSLGGDNTPQTIAVPAAAKAAARATVTGVITPGTDAATAADASLTIANSTYTLPVGTLALQAGGSALITQLTSLIDCNQVGVDVNAEVDNSYYDVTSLVTKICTAGLAQAALQVTKEITDFTLTGIQVQGITGQLSDAPVGSTVLDRQASVVKGTWSWEVPVAGNNVAVPSTWTGVRQ